MIRQMEIGKPILVIKYIEDENNFSIDQLAILVNIDVKGKRDIMIENIPLKPMKGTIVGHTVIGRIDSAVIIENYEEIANDPEIWDKVAKAWPVMYSLRPEERFKGLPFYSAQGECEVTPGIRVLPNAICKAVNLGTHKAHPRDIDEYHVQILGYGIMQKCHEQSLDTVFQELHMAPGLVHDLIFDANGEYPWHQYKSLGNAFFMGIHVDR